MRMQPTPKLIYEKPNIENTIPLSLYQSSSPEKFSIEDDDKFVIYGGGSGYRVSILRNDSSCEVNIHSELQQIESTAITLFVLNTNAVIWLDSAQRGLELPYQSIAISALQATDESQALYLQVLSNDYMASVPNEPSEYTSNVELIIMRDDSLRRDEYDPLLRGIASDIPAVYNALSTCSAFHFDSESDDENNENTNGFYGLDALETGNDGPSLEIPTSWIQNNGSDHDIAFRNVGDADDLEMDEEELQPEREECDTPIAGMNVDVGYASLAGSIRKRGEDEITETHKSRKLT